MFFRLGHSCRTFYILLSSYRDAAKQSKVQSLRALTVAVRLALVDPINATFGGKGNVLIRERTILRIMSTNLILQNSHHDPMNTKMSPCRSSATWSFIITLSKEYIDMGKKVYSKLTSE